MARTSLTPRQLEVVATVLAEGSRKCAAYQLGISRGSVDAHLERAFRKTGTSTFAQMVSWLDDHDRGWREIKHVRQLPKVTVVAARS